MRVGSIAVALFFAASQLSDADESTEFFERRVRPILAKHCYECHSADAAEENGHLALDAREGLLAGGTRGPVLQPKKPDESLLITAIKYSDPKLQMPPAGKLPDEAIATLVHWIEQGAIVPDYGGAAVRKSGKQIDWDAARQFWSFKPFANSLPPLLNRSQIDSAPLQPIDAFIQAEQHNHELRPSPMADRRTVIRRLSFDLIGLPPSADDVEAFISDTNPDAYERLTDRFLASPGYGERWGRYWLDLARYTDVTPSWLRMRIRHGCTGTGSSVRSTPTFLTMFSSRSNWRLIFWTNLHLAISPHWDSWDSARLIGKS
jgi:mono/diheme cytochrome c family protein